MISSSTNTTLVELDQQRNSMMRASLHLTMGTVGLAFFAGVTSALGMNLTHGYEEHPTAFMETLAAGGGTSVIVFGSLIYLY